MLSLSCPRLAGRARPAVVLCLAVLVSLLAFAPSVLAETRCVDSFDNFLKLKNFKAMAYGKENERCYWRYEAGSLKTAERQALRDCRKETQTCEIVDVFGAIAERDKEIQQALSELGFYDGAIDGKAGPATKAAVVAFQKERGLEQDGEVSDILLEWLQRDRFMTQMDDKAICRFATQTGPDGLGRWEDGADFRFHVTEAQKRSLTLEGCDSLLGRKEGDTATYELPDALAANGGGKVTAPAE